MGKQSQYPAHKAAYNKARSEALRDLARKHPEEYEQLVESHLGRKLDVGGRPLTQRVKRR